MRIVLVDPKGVWEGLNNGLASIAAMVRSQHSVHVIDFVNKQGSVDKRLEAVKTADLVGISIKSFTLVESVWLAQRIRALNPRAIIVAGGPHVIVDGYNLLKEQRVFDVGITGEAEFSFTKLANGEPYTAIPGLLYRDGEKIIQNARGEWLTDLDSLPFPVYDDFDSINENGNVHAIENWPLVTSRGCPYTCTYCFTAGTLVHTNKGMIPIEELKNHTELNVLSHSGKWMHITRFYERPYTGKVVKIKARKLPRIKATANHTLHILRNGIKAEISAEDVQRGDYLTVQFPEITHTEHLDVKQIIGEQTLVYEYSRKVPYEKIVIASELHEKGLSTRDIASKTGLSKSFVHAIIHNNFTEKKTVKNNIQIKNNNIKFRLSEGIPAILPVTEGLCRLFGYYLAEGSITKNKKRPNSYEVSWTFNKNETAYIEDVKYLIKNIFGLDTFVVNQQNVSRVCVSNAPFALLFEKLFGAGSDKKSIPPIIMSLKPGFLEELLKGWILGDGGIVNYNRRKMIKASTVSHSLAYQFFIIAQRLGLSPALQKNITGSSFIEGRELKSCGYNYHLSFKSRNDVSKLMYSFFGVEMGISEAKDSVEIRDVNSIFLPVENIETEDFHGTVYNIEVAEDHTYTANGFLVNNCNVPTVIGRKFRTRSGKNILDELRYARQTYRSTEFKVLDDNFTLQMERAKDICQLFINEKLQMTWSCPNGIRADRLDKELCDLMKEAGCTSICIGVESGDPAVFDKIRKGEKLEDVERGIRLAQEAGIKVHGFFILGLMGSTYEADKRSMEFAKRLGISASWGILVPYPGTEVWEQIKTDPQARILRDWKEGFHIGARPKPVFDTADYPAEERVKAFYLANMMFLKKKDVPRAAKLMIKGLIKDVTAGR